MSIQNKTFTVGEMMLNIDSFPIVTETAIVKEALDKMDIFGLGIACIRNNDNQLLGIITDGDIRRKLSLLQRPLSAFFIDDAINQTVKNPTAVSSDMILTDAVSLMEEKRVWDLPVVNNGKLVGLLHLHQAIRKILQLP